MYTLTANQIYALVEAGWNASYEGCNSEYNSLESAGEYLRQVLDEELERQNLK